MKEVLKIVCVIVASMSVCDLLALFVYSIRYIPTGLSEGICYPFYIPLKMQVALTVRLLQIIVIVAGIVFFVDFNSVWHIWLPIVTVVLAIINSIIYCLISY